MDNNVIKVGITQGDVNGVGYEVILRTFSNPAMLELCTPVVYGSGKVAGFHKKNLGIEVDLHTVAEDLQIKDHRLNIVNCIGEEIKVEFARADAEAGKAALASLVGGLEAYRGGVIDALVTAPLHEGSIRLSRIPFSGEQAYVSKVLGQGKKDMLVMLHEDLRIGVSGNALPLRRVLETLTEDKVYGDLKTLKATLERDFGIDAPRIAVLALNSDYRKEGNIEEREEEKVIIPAIERAVKEGMVCYGPYPVDEYFCTSLHQHFDAVLAIYQDQILTPFRILTEDKGVKFTAGLPVIHVSPVHDSCFGNAGKNCQSEEGFRNAIYVAMDVCKNRRLFDEALAHPLRKQYFDKRDDNEKLKLDEEELD